MSRKLGGLFFEEAHLHPPMWGIVGYNLTPWKFVGRSDRRNRETVCVGGPDQGCLV